MAAFRNNPYWKTVGDLFAYKRPMITAMVCAVLAASTFGVGLSAMLPIFELMFNSQMTVQEIIQIKLLDTDASQWTKDIGVWLQTTLPESPFGAFLVIMAVAMIISVFGSILRYIHHIIVLTVVQQEARRWRNRLFAKLLHTPMGAMYDGHADAMSRVINDVNVLSQGHQAILQRTFLELLKGIGVITVALFMDWRLTLIGMVGLPLVVVVMRKLGKVVRRATRSSLVQQGQMIGAMNESLSGLGVVKTSNAEGYERRRFASLNRTLFNQLMKMRRAKAVTGPVVETVAQFGIMLVACIAAWRIFEQGISPGRLMTVLGMLGAAAVTLKPLSSLNNELNAAGAGAHRLYEMLTLPAEPIGADADRSRPTLPRHAERIEFLNVSFVYPNADESAVSEVSLTVEAGQTIAMVGANGSGKTTLLSLVSRLLIPTEGQVLIDGVDVSTVSLRSLRRQIGLVTQNSVLFAGTVAHNIAYGLGNVSMERIIQAAKAAHADEFIRQMRGEYNRALGDSGQGLSGGQRQRICIARAILRDPAILILDEATSQIDADSEAKINNAIEQFSRNRTTFIIAHRLSTVIGADRIIVMNAGRIEAIGTHEKLLSESETYRTLCRTQLQGPSPEEAV
jgi:subfamily B ATP-binding cassette protein MsbA